MEISCGFDRKWIHPEENHVDAIAYDKQGNEMYLGIWQAADGEEIVLGDNSFGLWEGLVNNKPEIHRLFVVSPEVIVVLRHCLFRPDNLGDDIPAELLDGIVSSLFRIPMPTAVVEYGDHRYVSNLPPTEMGRYRATSMAFDDVFNFKITKLTPMETYAVNRTLMVNVRPSGSLTFSSKVHMLNTLLMCMYDPVTILERRDLIRLIPLLPHLDPTMRRPDVPETTLKEPHEMIDIPLFTMVIKIVTGVDTYGSRFDRAFIVFMHLGRDKSKETEFKLDLHLGLSLLRSSFLKGVPEAPPSRRRSHAQASTLLKRTPKHVYEPVFRSILNWGVARTSGFGHRSDPLSRLLDEVLITSFIDWTARRHPDVYDSLLDGRHPVLQFDGPPKEKEKEATGSKPKNRPNRRGRARLTPPKPSPDPSPVIDPASKPVDNRGSDGEILGDYIMVRFVQEILSGKATFRCDYERALAVYQLAVSDDDMENPFSVRIRADLPIMSRAPAVGVTPMTIVDSCSPKESEAFFSAMARFAENMGYPVELSGTQQQPSLATLHCEVLLVGLASSLASKDPDVVREVLRTCGLEWMLVLLA